MNDWNEVPKQFAVLDWAQALRAVDGEEELLKEIAELFLEEGPQLMEKIRDAVHRADADGVERAAHSLKGSVSNFGAKPAYEAALELERSGRSGQFEEMGPMLAKLDGALKALMPELAAVARKG